MLARFAALQRRIAGMRCEITKTQQRIERKQQIQTDNENGHF